MRGISIFILAVTLFATGLPVAIHAAQRSAADKQLYQRAVKACNSNSYPSGTRPYINYAGGWFRCVEPKWMDR